MRARSLALALLLAALLMPLAGEAQRGRGGERPRPGEPRGRAVEPAHQPALAPGEYGLAFDQVLQAINRGEGHQALAFYERSAARAEQGGDRLLAARAQGAAAAAAVRLGLFQKALQTGSRSLDLYNAVDGDAALGREDLRRMAQVRGQIAGAYRRIGDFAQARKVLEEGLAVAETRLTGRDEAGMVATLSHALARPALVQRDYQMALTRSTQAAQFFEDTIARLPPRAPERRRTSLLRLAALSLVEVGRTMRGRRPWSPRSGKSTTARPTS